MNQSSSFSYENRITKSYSKFFTTAMSWKKSINYGTNCTNFGYLALFLISWSLFYVISKDKQVWKSQRLCLIFLIWILTAVGIVRAVVTLSHVGELMDLGVQFGHPRSRDQERREVEQIHKHFVTITVRKSERMTFTLSHNLLVKC